MRMPKSLHPVALTLLLAATVLGLGAWYFGPQGPFRFTLEWDEEVQLHDARIINIHIKRSYERQSLLSRWDGLHHATEISFDAGPPIGRFSMSFQAYDVALIEHRDEVWYVGLTRSANAPPTRPGDWQLPFLMLRPDGRMAEPVNAGSLPPEFIKWNVMPATPDPEGVASFHNTQVRLPEKMRYWATHRRAQGEDVVRLGPKL
jgi:hypothetical protein